MSTIGRFDRYKFKNPVTTFLIHAIDGWMDGWMILDVGIDSNYWSLRNFELESNIVKYREE